MYIKNLKVKDFRNLEDMALMPNSGLNVFIGKNGQGKTNLLETIYVASKGKSFRPGKIKEWRNEKLNNTEVSILEFEISDGNFNHNLKFICDTEKKQILLDDKKVTTGKLIKILPTILFSPESLLAIKEGPEKRRDLIDQIVSSSFETQHDYNQYKKALTNRNKFFRTCKDTGEFNDILYRSLNVLFLNFSTKLSLARIGYLHKLDPYIKKTINLIFNEDLDYKFEYLISNESVKDWTGQEVLNLHQKRAAELKTSEIKAGVSLVGAHKHDLKFYLNQKDSRYYSSQGQQRGLILAIKMAEVLYRYNQGERPILLLDDVLSELDASKREKLLNFLKGFKTQVFITTTEFLEKNKLEGHYYNIENGSINSNDQNKCLES